jgi:hypothetical protein
LLHIGIGDVGRGLCGGMAFAARDRFERDMSGAMDAEPPAPGTPLFREIVDRQFASFGTLFIVPLRFWLAAALGSERTRARGSVARAWPAIRREIDTGHPAMIGLVRKSGWNPIAPDFGHQVVAYRYASSPERVAIGVYDPNHPGDDSVELVIEKSAGGEIRLSQTTGEPLLGILSLPFAAAR